MAHPDDAILPGHWTSRITDAVAAKAARQLVAQHHGRAGAALLRPGERALTAHRITEHGHTARPPASPTTRAAAKAAFATTQTHRHLSGWESRPLRRRGQTCGVQEGSTPSTVQVRPRYPRGLPR